MVQLLRPPAIRSTATAKSSVRSPAPYYRPAWIAPLLWGTWSRNTGIQAQSCPLSTTDRRSGARSVRFRLSPPLETTRQVRIVTEILGGMGRDPRHGEFRKGL